MNRVMVFAFGVFAACSSVRAAIDAGGSSTLATRVATAGSVSFTATSADAVRVVVSGAVPIDTRPRGGMFLVR